MQHAPEWHPHLQGTSLHYPTVDLYRWGDGTVVDLAGYVYYHDGVGWLLYISEPPYPVYPTKPFPPYYASSSSGTKKLERRERIDSKSAFGEVKCFLSVQMMAVETMIRTSKPSSRKASQIRS